MSGIESRLVQTWRLWLAALLAGLAMMMPAQKAQAMTVWDALDTVCSQAQDLCGPYDQAKGVIEGCFKGSNELTCAISIINVASGGGVRVGIPAQSSSIDGGFEGVVEIADHMRRTAWLS